VKSGKTITWDSFVEELGHLSRIAIPLLIAQSAQMGTGVVDTVMAARYGEQDLAAIAVGFNIWLPIYLLILGTIFATATIVAQDYGAGRIKKIQDSLPQSLWLAVFLGLVLSPAAWFSGPVMDLLGLESTTKKLALEYTQMVALGLPATAIFQALRYHTQGLGVTQPFAVAAAIGFFLNIPLNYAFIFGEWGAPELGAKGCGIATAISMWLSVVMMVGYIAISKRIRPYLPEWAPVSPNWLIIREILTIGMPMGLTFFLEVGVFSLIALLVATWGDTANSVQYLGSVLHPHAGHRYSNVHTNGPCYWCRLDRRSTPRVVGWCIGFSSDGHPDDPASSQLSRGNHCPLHRFRRDTPCSYPTYKTVRIFHSY
jgi:MATE family multidrug resistance protein